MWRCPRCGARNTRAVTHCHQCGMASPFDDGGRTQTMDMPALPPPEPPRRRRAVPWAIVTVLVVLLLIFVLVAIVALAS